MIALAHNLGLLAVLWAGDGGVSDGAARPAEAIPTPTPAPTPAPAPASTIKPMATLPRTAADLSSAKADKEAGAKLLRKGQYAEARALFERALAKSPESFFIATDLGTALARLERREEAEKAFRRAIELNPKHWPAYAGLCDMLGQDPTRWKRRDEIIKLAEDGLGGLGDDRYGRVNLTIRLADFERAVARTSAARARLKQLEASTHLSASERKRVLDLEDEIGVDERARALEDLPEPAPGAADGAALAAAERRLADGDASAALREADRLGADRPTWRGPRWLRARAQLALGRLDDAGRELTVLLQLAPSHAEAWRQLGVLLEGQGGALEAERADEALRHALALEPAWTDLWLFRARLAVRRGRGADAERLLERYLKEAPERAGDSDVRHLRDAARAHLATGATAGRRSHVRTEPSAHARELCRQAQEYLALGETGDTVKKFLVDALADSPGYVDAAATMFSVAGALPPDVIAGFWEDGPSLLALAAQVRKVTRDEATRKLVLPWLDRACELGAPEAHWDRALVRLEDGDRAGAEVDLVAYIAGAPMPEHLDEARALRSTLIPTSTAAGATTADAAPLLARIRLVDDRPAEAIEALGGRCERGEAPPRLVALGKVEEFAGDLPAALECYGLALGDKATGDATTTGAGATTATTTAQRGAERRETLSRLAEAAARAPASALLAARPALEEAAAAGVAAASYALARLDATGGHEEAALRDYERYLHDAPADAPHAAAARAARDKMQHGRDALAQARKQRWLVIGGGALALLLALLAAFTHGATLASALERRPGLFPEVARTVADLRHDVLKHRASVLGMLVRPDASGAGAATRGEVARALREPQPASAVVAEGYERLRQAASARGVPLRRLGREPAFGPLYRDLRSAESLLMGSGGDKALARIDERLRDVHPERLGALLALGPRTRVDAGLLAEWIQTVEAEVRARQAPWTAPTLVMQGMTLDFPVDGSALVAIFSNLLRNAQAAASGAASGGDATRPVPGIVVRAGEERDAVGRRLYVLAVGDSADGALTLETIEARESGRGLAIVRDLVREWRGHLVIRPEPAPLTKTVGACFPV